MPMHRKTPIIAVPKFNGNPADSISYLNLFKTMIIDLPISNVKKLAHLKSSLSEDPLFLIKDFSISEDNFDAAVEELFIIT